MQDPQVAPLYFAAVQRRTFLIGTAATATTAAAATAAGGFAYKHRPRESRNTVSVAGDNRTYGATTVTR
jgi:hypothetical protein